MVKNLGSLGIAILASVALHIVVLGLLLCSRGCGSAVTPQHTSPSQKDVRTQDMPGAKDSETTTETNPADVRTKDVTTKTSDSKPDSEKSEEKKNETKTPVDKRPDAKPAEGVSGEWKNYKVKPGDSLTRIARSCGMTVHELAKANKLSPTASLMLGQTLKVKDVPADDVGGKKKP